jgi:hypothetical protein
MSERRMVRIRSAGTPETTTVTDLATGTNIPNITEISLGIKAGDPVNRALIMVVGPEIDIVANADIVTEAEVDDCM